MYQPNGIEGVRYTDGPDGNALLVHADGRPFWGVGNKPLLNEVGGGGVSDQARRERHLEMSSAWKEAQEVMQILDLRARAEGKSPVEHGDHFDYVQVQKA